MMTGKIIHFGKIPAGILTLLLTLCLGFSTCVYASDPLTNYMPEWPQMEDITPESACLIDAENGAVLYSLNRDEKHYPASITKILTCLLTIENCQMTDVVTMGEEALAVAIDGNANISPVLGEQFTVEQCLYMLMLKSANDVAIQLAIQVAGSVSAFSDMMNARAASLGCTGTHFNNPNGLPDENHYTTAYDMALIMQECLKNETFRQLIATRTYIVGPTNMTNESRVYDNHNRLIDPDNEAYYPECIGGKTGYTDAAQRTLVAAAERDGRTLICVTMYCPDGSDFYDMQKLFDYGFENFTLQNVDENDGTTATTGSYTVPNGVTDYLTKEELGETEDGRTYFRYLYNDQIPVGSGFITTLALPESSVEETESAESNSDGTAESTAASKSSDDSESLATGGDTGGTGTGSVGREGSETEASGSAGQHSFTDLSLKALITLAAAAAALVVMIVMIVLLIVTARREKAARLRAEERRRKRREMQEQKTEE